MDRNWKVLALAHIKSNGMQFTQNMWGNTQIKFCSGNIKVKVRQGVEWIRFSTSNDPRQLCISNEGLASRLTKSYCRGDTDILKSFRWSKRDLWFLRGEDPNANDRMCFLMQPTLQLKNLIVDQIFSTGLWLFYIFWTSYI